MIHCFYGLEMFLINEKITKIKSEFENIDIISYSLLDTDIEKIIQDASSISLFDQPKMIIVKDPFFLKSKKKENNEEDLSLKEEMKLESFLHYLEHPNPDVQFILVLEAETLDERKKVVKEIRKKAHVEEFKKKTNDELYQFIKQRIQTNKKKISREAIHELILKTTGNLYIIENEIKKLVLYKLEEEEITKEDVKLVVRKVDTEDIFDLIHALLQHQTAEVLRIYYELLSYNEEPIKILVLIANQFRLIYQTKALKSEGLKNEEIAQLLGAHPYSIQLAQEVPISMPKLLSYLRELADLDYDIKTGNINKEVGIELFLTKI